MAEGPFLVTGASGNLGRLVLAELLNSYGIAARDIIATTRSPETLDDFAARGIAVRRADFDSPETLPGAFAGARRVLVISTTPEAPYAHGKRFRQQSAAIEAAAQAGAEQILYTSAPNPEPGTPCFWKEDHYLTELALKECGTDWTILRHWEWPDWHFSENWRRGLETGEYFAGTGSGRVSHVTREDCARAAAGALISDISANRRFDITGPEGLTIDDIMSTLSELNHRPIKVTHGTVEEYGERLLAAGENPDFVSVFVAFARAVRHGLFDGVTDHIQMLSGKEPTTLREYLASGKVVLRQH